MKIPRLHLYNLSAVGLGHSLGFLTSTARMRSHLLLLLQTRSSRDGRHPRAPPPPPPPEGPCRPWSSWKVSGGRQGSSAEAAGSPVP